MPAPVIIFAYRRPGHLKSVLDALRKNDLAPQTTLFVICDGPANAADATAVNKVREVIKEQSEGFADVQPIYRPKNLGLAANIVSGVTELIKQYGEVIVLEDDLVPAPFFLRYMNDALNVYRHEDGVVCIHGYCYPVQTRLPETFFLRGADCWGWATWERGWSRFRPDGKQLLQELTQQGLIKRLDFNGMYPYTRMLQDQIAGLNDSWAIRWYASTLLDGGLTLYPHQSLVLNIGNDGSGRHSHRTCKYDIVAARQPVRVERLALRENTEALAAFTEYFRGIRPHLVLRVGATLVRALRRHLRDSK